MDPTTAHLFYNRYNRHGDTFLAVTPGCPPAMRRPTFERDEVEVGERVLFQEALENRSRFPLVRVASGYLRVSR